MRRLPFQIGTDLQVKQVEDPWRRRMPSTIYIAPVKPKRAAAPAAPVAFGKRPSEDRPTARRKLRLSLSNLAGFFQGPRKTRRTKAR
jgi:hypothetical protein